MLQDWFSNRLQESSMPLRRQLKESKTQQRTLMIKQRKIESDLLECSIAGRGISRIISSMIVS